MAPVQAQPVRLADRNVPVVPPLSFAPLPATLLPASPYDAPRYAAQGLTGRFVFDTTGYTLMTDDGDARTPTGESYAAEVAGVRMQFEGASEAVLAPGRPLPGVVNDLRGSDPAAWRTGIPTYGLLTYRGLYPGIDLVYEGMPGRFKGTYAVAPGADPGQIRWRYNGAASVEVHRTTGELWVRLPSVRLPSVRLPSERLPAAADGAYLIEGAPLVWQDVGARRIIVPARFEVAADGAIGYALGEYDPTRPLTIDPWVTFAVLAGGSDADEGRAFALDAQGNLYITGTTRSADFPSAGPACWPTSPYRPTARTGSR